MMDSQIDELEALILKEQHEIKQTHRKLEVAHKINLLNYVTNFSDIFFITFTCYTQPSCNERSHKGTKSNAKCGLYSLIH